MPPSDTARHWSARLAEVAAAAMVNGAVLGIWAEGRRTLAAHGVLSTATGVAVTPDSVFQIGSITKPWTATMIMQLVDEERLSLDATVADVLPGVRLGTPDVAAQVRIEHLLTHTSGVDGDIFADTGRGDECVRRYVDELADAAVGYPAGQAYSYCNSGFVLLGRIIEVLDGRVWDESLRRRLTGPLGLRRTVTLPEEAILHRAAVGHQLHPHEAEPRATWMLPRSLGPAGLITASAGDLLTFARLHLDGGVTEDRTRLLSEDAATSMREPRSEIPGAGSGPDAIGLGWQLSHWDGRRVAGHSGDTIGQSAFLRMDPASGVAVCLLTNAADARPAYQRLFAEVLAEHAGIVMPAEPEPAAIPAAEGARAADGGLGRHVGRYERTSRRFDVSLSDGRLRLLSTVTGSLAAVSGAEPEELDQLAADESGDNFLCRSHEAEPWTSVSFRALADGTPYLYASGRVTPRVG